MFSHTPPTNRAEAILKKMDVSIAPPPCHTEAKADPKGKGPAAGPLCHSELQPESSEGTDSDSESSESASIQVCSFDYL